MFILWYSWQGKKQIKSPTADKYMLKAISDHIRNLKLYTNLVPCPSWNQNCMFSFNMLPALVKQKIDINMRVFIEAKNYVVCPEFTMGSKFHFSLMENTFFPIHWGNGISHYVWNVNSLIFSNPPILF